MRTRHFGSTRPPASALGLGCIGMTGAYGPVDEAASIATIHAALDGGISLRDTADLQYNECQHVPSDNRVSIGLALRSTRALCYGERWPTRFPAGSRHQRTVAATAFGWGVMEIASGKAFW
jgi:aryl-alcohol dehydrogenase-like predicted oxidoreductase